MTSQAERADAHGNSNNPSLSSISSGSVAYNAAVWAEAAAVCSVQVVSVDDVLPATPFQEAMVSLTSRDPGAYVTHRGWTVNEQVALSTVHESWFAICRANPIMRTRLVHIAAVGMLQVVLSGPASFVWDEGGMQGDDSAFTLGRPLLRFSVHGRHLTLSIHHALYDGWSLTLIFDDLAKACKGESLPQRPPFSSFVEYLAKLKREEEQEYWMGQLSEISTRAFPPQAPVAHPVTCSERIEISVLLHREAASDITAATVVTGAWAAVVSRFTNQRDVCFALLTSGRFVPITRPSQVIGPLVATVPLRVQVDPNASICSFGSTLQNSMTEMMPHVHFGLQHIEQSLRDAGTDLALNHLFAVHPHSEPCDPIFLVPDEVEDVNPADFSTYPLHVSCALHAEEVAIKLRFDPSIVTRSVAASLLDYYASVLERMAQLELQGDMRSAMRVPKADSHQLAETVHDDVQVVEECVTTLFERRVTMAPTAEAVFAWDQSLTYATLNDLANRLAGKLRRHGVGPEVYCCICLERSSMAVVGVLGIMKAGGVGSPIDISYGDERMRTILRKCQAAVVVCSPEYSERLRGVTSVPLVELEMNALAGFDDADAEPDVMNVKPENAVYTIWTSGSTGEPKGCILEHRNLASSALAHGPAEHISSTSRVFFFSSLVWDESLCEIITTLLAGGCVCVPPEERRLSDTINVMNDLRVTWAALTPSFARCVDLHRVATLQTLVLIGEVIGQDNVDRYRDSFHLLSGYGPSECSIVSCVADFSADRGIQSGCLGKGCGARIWIVDPADPATSLPPHAIGEILIEGPNVGRGYLGDDAKTAQSFLRNLPWTEHRRFYRSGDLGKLDSEGNLTLVGREDDQVKIRGQRLELGDVEHHLSQHPSVKQAVVLSQASSQATSTHLAAVLTFNNSHATSDPSPPPLDPLSPPAEVEAKRHIAELKAFLARSLPAFAIPTVWLAVGSLPFTQSGKLDRVRIQKWASKAVDTRSGARPDNTDVPRSVNEKRLQRAWEAVLQTSAELIGLDSSFAQLRGDSIDAIKLSSLLRTQGHLLRVTDVFRYPLLRDMASKMTVAPATDAEVKQFELLKPSCETEQLISPAATICGLPVEAVEDMYPARLTNLLQEAAAECSLELADIEDIYPATPVQETFWLAEIAHPGTSSVRLVYRTADEVPLPQLRAAWRAVTDTHHILRTRLVHLSNQKTYQVVSRKVPAVAQVTGWGDIESDGRQGEVANGNLCSLAQAGPYVILRMHHACYDGFSLPLIVDDLMRACYGDTLKQLPVFRDFVRVAMDPAKHAPSEQFWRQTLRGARETQFPHVPGASLATSTKRLSLVFAPPRYTISAVVHAAWALLLSICGGSDDVIFGSVLAGRDAPVDDIVRMPGPTMATIPLRCIVNRAQPIQEFLYDVQQRSLDAMEHQHFGIPNIRQISPDAKAACDFHTWVNILPPESASASARWTLDPEKSDDALGNYAHYAMTIQVFQNSEGADFSLLYSPSLMSSRQADCLFQCYQEMFHKLSTAHGHVVVADIIPTSLASLRWAQQETPETPLDNVLPETSATYWKRYLSDCEPCRIPLGSDDYIHEETTDSAESFSAAQLHTFCHGHKVTPSDVVSAAWALLLASYTGEVSACFGYLHSSGASKPTPGMAVRMQVCRIEIDATESFIALIDRIRKDRFASLPFSNITVDSMLDGAASNASLFNTVVSTRESDLLPPAEEAGIHLEQVGDSDVAQWGSVPWDLFVDTSHGTEKLSLRLKHSRNVGPKFATRVMKTLVSILRTMLSLPEACCSHPDLTSADDKSQIVKWNHANVEPDHSEYDFVHSLIAAQTQSTPDVPAVVAWDGCLTYYELDSVSTNLAHHLVGLGIRTGDSVPYCMGKSVWTPMVIVAIMKSGGVFTPLNPEDPIERQRLLLETTAARGLIVCPNQRHLFVNLAIPIVVADPVFFNTLPERNGAACDGLRPESIVYALHTSGSTGVSRTVLVDHSAWLTCNLLLGSLLHYKRGTKALQFATHVWDVSLSELITPLVYGGTTYIPSEQDRLYGLTAFINKHKINWAYITPSVARTLVPAEVPSLETLALVGEPVRQDDIQQWQSHVQLRVLYGACETGAHTSVAEFENGSRKSPRNIGCGVNGSRFYLVHPHDPQRLAPIGAIGEIVCASAHLAVGYLNDEQKTAEAFPEGLTWIEGNSGNPKRRGFRTGDLARYNPNGSMDYVARKGGFVKVRGQRIELGNLEEKVLQCPSVRHTACAVPDGGPLKRRLVCLVVLAGAHVSGAAAETLKITDSSLGEGTSVRIDEVRNRVVETAPAYARPDVWIVVEALPFNASHKLARRKIHDWLTESSLDALSCAVSSAPTAVPVQESEIEQKVRFIWAEVLDLPGGQVHTDRSFLSHGGDSISSIRLVSALRRAGFHTTATDVLRGLTIAAIAGEAEPTARGSPTLAGPTSHLHVNPGADPQSATDNLRGSIDSTLILPQDLRQFRGSDNIEAIHDCSPLQDGVITAQASSPERYKLSMIFRLWRKRDDGLALTPAQVEVAWSRVVAQHQMLRTLFADSSSVSTLFSQVVLKRYTPKTTRFLAPSKEEAVRILGSQQLPIEEQQPPHHLAICGVNDSPAVLCRLDISHACVDGLSLALLWRDVCLACDSELPSRQLPTYGRYVADMRRNLDVPAASQYWREQLRKTIPCNVSVSPLGVSRARRIEKFPVPFTGVSQLQSFCRTTSLTAASIVRAAWAIVLSLCTRQESCCFGYVSSGRDHTTFDMREVVGPFLDILLCTATVSRRQSVHTLVCDMQASFIESLPHQFAAFTRFARESLRGGGRLFNTVVSVWPTALRAETTDSAVDYDVLQMDDPTEYDLALTAIFSDTPPRIWLAVDRSRFSASQARRIAAMSGQILHSIITVDQSATIDSVLTVRETKLQATEPAPHNPSLAYASAIDVCPVNTTTLTAE